MGAVAKVSSLWLTPAANCAILGANGRLHSLVAEVVKEQQVEFSSHLLYQQAQSCAISVLSSRFELFYFILLFFGLFFF